MPDDADPPASAATSVTPGLDDLTWLAYRAADALGAAFNKVSRDAGLTDLRDWLVLALLTLEDTERTQLEIATHLGIDRSTLVPILDRLERDGLVVRTTSERDRRVRIPKVTPEGVKVYKKVAIAREEAIDERLSGIQPSDRAAFHATLWRIVAGTRQGGDTAPPRA